MSLEVTSQVGRVEAVAEAARALNLKPQRPGHLVRHLDGCAALSDVLASCNCGISDLWYVLRWTSKEGSANG